MDTPLTQPSVSPSAVPNAEELLNTGEVAALLRCSSRHVRRLAASGRLPDPVLLGRLRRWRRFDVDWWIYLGCPDSVSFSERMRVGGVMGVES